MGHVGQQQIDEVHADPVEHDGGDDLVDVEIRLEQARENAPRSHRRQRPPAGRRTTATGIEWRTAAREKSAHRVLAGRTNVEQARLERKADGQAAHHQGCRLVQHLAELVHAGKKPVASRLSCRPRRRQIQQDQAVQSPAPDRRRWTKRLARTPTTAGRCRSGCLFCLLMLSPPLAFWHRPYTGPVPRRWSFFGSNSPTISPS